MKYMFKWADHGSGNSSHINGPSGRPVLLVYMVRGRTVRKLDKATRKYSAEKIPDKWVAEGRIDLILVLGQYESMGKAKRGAEKWLSGTLDTMKALVGHFKKEDSE